jgi:hypothetical protein
MMEIEENHLLELVWWARRYCDGRATYAATCFNSLYENLTLKYPELPSKDQFDPTLKDKGRYWPWAQDGMYNETTGSYEARPRSTIKNEKED